MHLADHRIDLASAPVLKAPNQSLIECLPSKAGDVLLLACRRHPLIADLSVARKLPKVPQHLLTTKRSKAPHNKTLPCGSRSSRKVVQLLDHANATLWHNDTTIDQRSGTRAINQSIRNSPKNGSLFRRAYSPLCLFKISGNMVA